MLNLLKNIETIEIYNTNSKTTARVANITAKMTNGEKLIFTHGYAKTTEIEVDAIKKLRKFDNNRAMEIWVEN
jgi:hypothetical protein